MTGDENQDARRQQLLLGELVAGLLRRDEIGEHVGAGRGPAAGDQLPEVAGERVTGLGAPLADLRARREQQAVETARDVETPGLESLVILDRHPEHLADHGDGDRIGEVLDQLQGARRLGAIEEAIDDLLDARTQSFHHPGRERLADETAEPGMVRRIAIEHRQSHGGHRRAEPSGDELGDRLLGQAGIAERRHDVLVPRQHPEPERIVMHGIVGAQPMVGRIRIRDELGIHGIEVHVAHVSAPADRGAAGSGRRSASCPCRLP